MGFFTKSKKDDNPRFRREMAARIASHTLKYVSERVGDTDNILSKGGAMSIKDGIFSISAGTETIFSCECDKMTSGEFLSMEGAIIEGADTAHGGVCRKIIVYYVYYR